MIGDVRFETQGNKRKPVNGVISPYLPGDDVQKLTRQISCDYQTGLDVLTKPYREFNNLSVIEEMNLNQRAFLMHPDDKLLGPEEAWRWNEVRPIVRSKVMSLTAHLTSKILIPAVFAQNDQDEEDKELAEIMRLRLEWHIRNSDYDMTFICAIISMLVNPVSYMSVETVKAMQIVKKRLEDGSIKIEKAVDDILSGLRVDTVPLDEVFITNPYEFDIQRQKAVSRRRYIEYSELESLYGDHKNWKFVSSGKKSVFVEEESSFYDLYDDTLRTVGELFIYENRKEDLCVPFVNGVYLGDDDVYANPMKHRDQENRPKYGLVKFGAEPIDEKRFFFYKSVVSKLLPDYKLANRTWQIAVDTETINLKPPLGIIGNDKLSTDIYFPGASFTMSPETQFKQVPTASTAGAYNLIAMADKNMSEASQDPVQQGIAASGSQTAFEIAKLQQNSQIQLGLLGKSVARAIKDVGNLMIDDVIMHDTVGEVLEVLPNSEARMKFLKFSVPNKTEGGKTITKEVRFEESLIGMEMDEDEEMSMKQKLFEEEGGEEAEKRIYLVNPNKFRKCKFMAMVDVEELTTRNDAFDTAMRLDAYSKAITNPLVQSDREPMYNVTRDLLFGSLKATRGNEEKYLPKKSPMPAIGAGIPPQGVPEGEVQPPPKGVAERSVEGNPMARMGML